MSLRSFLAPLALEDFEDALLEVTGLGPRQIDFAKYVQEEDIQELLQPQYGMRKPQLRKLWTAIENLQKAYRSDVPAPKSGRATATQQVSTRANCAPAAAGPPADSPAHPAGPSSAPPPQSQAKPHQSLPLASASKEKQSPAPQNPAQRPQEHAKEKGNQQEEASSESSYTYSDEESYDSPARKPPTRDQPPKGAARARSRPKESAHPPPQQRGLGPRNPLNSTDKRHVGGSKSAGHSGARRRSHSRRSRSRRSRSRHRPGPPPRHGGGHAQSTRRGGSTSPHRARRPSAARASKRRADQRPEEAPIWPWSDVEPWTDAAAAKYRQSRPRKEASVATAALVNILGRGAVHGLGKGLTEKQRFSALSSMYRGKFDKSTPRAAGHQTTWHRPQQRSPAAGRRRASRSPPSRAAASRASQTPPDRAAAGRVPAAHSVKDADESSDDAWGSWRPGKSADDKASQCQ